MTCFRALRAIDLREAGWLAPSESRRLDQHLASCAPCARELARRERAVALVREAGAIDALPSLEGFEQVVLRAARTRAVGKERGATIWAAPLPVAAAAALMIVASLLAMVRGMPPMDPQTMAMAAPAAQDTMMDDTIAPREIPFVVQEDLTGERRGRIPATTYVLEPPPSEAPVQVLRASL